MRPVPSRFRHATSPRLVLQSMPQVTAAGYDSPGPERAPSHGLSPSASVTPRDHCSFNAAGAGKSTHNHPSGPVVPSHGAANSLHNKGWQPDTAPPPIHPCSARRQSAESEESPLVHLRGREFFANVRGDPQPGSVPGCQKEVVQAKGATGPISKPRKVVDKDGPSNGVDYWVEPDVPFQHAGGASHAQAAP